MHDAHKTSSYNAPCVYSYKAYPFNVYSYKAHPFNVYSYKAHPFDVYSYRHNSNSNAT
jgi:hypothetical protein